MPRLSAEEQKKAKTTLRDWLELLNDKMELNSRDGSYVGLGEPDVCNLHDDMDTWAALVADHEAAIATKDIFTEAQLATIEDYVRSAWSDGYGTGKRYRHAGVTGTMMPHIQREDDVVNDIITRLRGGGESR